MLAPARRRTALAPLVDCGEPARSVAPSSAPSASSVSQVTGGRRCSSRFVRGSRMRLHGGTAPSAAIHARIAERAVARRPRSARGGRMRKSS